NSDLHTSLYEPDTTFPEFREQRIHTMPINRVRALRRHHRRALPVLAASFSRVVVDADVVVCSSSGWAHRLHATGRKVAYCYTPPRWLYAEHYLGAGHRMARVSLSALRPYLLGWDRRSAGTADRYVCISRTVRDRIRAAYGIDAEVLAPPHAL